MVKNVAMHNGKTVLHNVINLYTYICAYIYTYIRIKYTYIYICMYCRYCPELNPSWQPSLEVDHRLKQTTVDTGFLQYLLEEFCRSAKATQHQTGSFKKSE